jgi:hypothetical protein
MSYIKQALEDNIYAAISGDWGRQFMKDNGIMEFRGGYEPIIIEFLISVSYSQEDLVPFIEGDLTKIQQVFLTWYNNSKFKTK